MNAKTSPITAVGRWNLRANKFVAKHAKKMRNHTTNEDCWLAAWETVATRLTGDTGGPACCAVANVLSQAFDLGVEFHKAQTRPRSVVGSGE